MDGCHVLSYGVVARGSSARPVTVAAVAANETKTLRNMAVQDRRFRRWQAKEKMLNNRAAGCVDAGAASSLV